MQQSICNQYCFLYVVVLESGPSTPVCTCISAADHLDDFRSDSRVYTSPALSCHSSGIGMMHINHLC